MIQNPITFVVSNNGTILGGQRGTIRALSNYASKIYLVAPFEGVSIKVNYLIYETQREIIGQYLAPTSLKGSDVLSTNDAQYQTAASWQVWEVSISQRALHRIAKYRAGRIGVSFEVTSITQPSQALDYQGLFGKSQSDVLPESADTIGDYFVCDSYNFTSNDILFTKGDYAYWNGTTWLKGQNIQLVANTVTQDLAVDPSLQAEIPADISEDAELEALIDELIGDVTDLHTDLNAHLTDLDDPHDTQANQVDGTYRSLDSDVQASLNTIADEIDGITDGETDITYDPSTDDVIDATTVDGALHELDAALYTHITDFENPHNVVATQVTTSNFISVDTAITNLETDKVEKNPDTITSVSSSNKVYVNDGSEKLITVGNLKTSIIEDLVAFGYVIFTEKDENGQPVIASPQTNKIYLFNPTDSDIENDQYEEWIYIDSAFEKIGTTGMALSDYVQKAGDTMTGTLEVPELVIDGQSITWNDVDGTFNFELLDGVTLQAGQEVHFYGKAQSAVTNGQAVMFTGVQGDHILFAPATATALQLQPELFIGVATHDIGLGEFGYITWFGYVRDISTDGLSLGDILYVNTNTGATDGTFTTTKPSQAIIQAAAVVKLETGSSNNGILLVRPKFVSRTISDITGLQTELDTIDNHIADTTNPHEVTAAQVGAYTTSEVDYELAFKSDIGHTHIISDVTNLQDELDGKSDVGHTHDDRYYTETELNNGQLDTRYYTETEVDNLILNNSTTTHTQTESIKSVPVGTLDGQVSGFEAEGLTLENSVVNGDFSDGTTGWLGRGGAVISNVNNQLKVVQSLGTDYVQTPNPIIPSVTSGTKIFTYVKFKLTSASSINFTTTTAYENTGPLTNANKVLPSPTQNVWYEVTNIATALDTDQYWSFQNLILYFRTNGASEYLIDDVLFINMTALGIENYTEAQMLDLVRSGYFDGLTSVEQPSITSVGKNLFDGQWFQGYRFNNSSSGNAISIDKKIKGITGQTYRFSYETIKTSSVVKYDTYDANGVVVRQNSNGDNLTLANNEYYFDFFVYNANGITSDDITKPQIEQGSTATAYEPYKSSTLALNTPLRSLPNGVRDRVYEQNGEVWLEKRIEEYVLQSADVDSVNKFGDNFTNLDYAYINKTVLAGYNSSNIDNLSFITDNYNTLAYADNASNIGTINANGTTTFFLVGFANGTTLEQARTALAGTVIQYQLATPQLINLTEQGLADGQLTAYANGTIYNTSTTFHPDIQFAVNSNRSAQIEALIDNSDYQAKLIDSKASKVQEDWIEPTLLNGWVNYGGDFNNASYYKDEFGVVHLRGLIKSGTTTAGTDLFVLPVKYRPSGDGFFVNVANSSFKVISVKKTGVVELSITGDSNWTSLENISFKVGE